MNNRDELKRLLRNPDRAMVIEASVELGADEIAYLSESMEAVLEPLVWQRVTGQSNMNRRFGLAGQFREFGTQVESEVTQSIAAAEPTVSLRQVSEMGTTVVLPIGVVMRCAPSPRPPGGLPHGTRAQA